MGMPPKSSDKQLGEAVRKSLVPPARTLPSTDLFGFNTIDSLGSYDPFDPERDGIESYAHNAFSGVFYNHQAEAVNLMTVYILHHIKKVNARVDVNGIAENLTDTDTTSHLVGENWKGRSLLGHFISDNCIFQQQRFVNESNADFTRIFTDKLDAIFATAKENDCTVQIFRDILHSVALQLCFKYGFDNSPLRVYSTIHTAIDLHESGDVVTAEMMSGGDYRYYINEQIMLRQSDVLSGDTYIINKDGLSQFCDLMESLGLAEQRGHHQIAERIRNL